MAFLFLRKTIVVGEKEDKLLYQRAKKGDYVHFFFMYNIDEGVLF